MGFTKKGKLYPGPSQFSFFTINGGGGSKNKKRISFDLPGGMFFLIFFVQIMMNIKIKGMIFLILLINSTLAA